MTAPSGGKHAHFIGICGAGMSAVAHLMQEAGWRITGSDEGFYPPVSDFVASMGIETFTGYRASNITDSVDLIVIGKNAKLVPETNEEVALALTRFKDRVKSFPEVVADFAATRHNVVVAGSYGKSTVTALIAHVAAHAGLDPSYVIGALPKGFKATSHLGTGDLFILEGDEYPAANWDARSKFEHYNAHCVVLTAACHDHVNVFPTLADYHAPFVRLLDGLAARDGLLVASVDEVNARSFFTAYPGRKRSYGLDDGDVTATDLSFGAGTSFTIRFGGKPLVRIRSHLLGRHNVENVLAAAAFLVGEDLVSPQAFADAIADFSGLTRRLDRKVPVACPVHVYEGFGSSFEKARSAIDAMRLHFPDARLTVLFEPHTFTWRNRVALPQYKTAFADTDRVWLYHPPSQGAATHDQVTLDEIAAVARTHHPDIRTFDRDTAAAIADATEPGDAVLVLSSGSFDGLQQGIIDAIAARHAPDLAD